MQNTKEKKTYNDDTPENRKKLNLPKTKQLVYVAPGNKLFYVKNFAIISEYNNNDYWAILELKFEDGSEIRIHSMFFKEMQDRNFIR